MADAFTPVSGIIRKVAAIDEVVNGIIHKTPKIPVPVNGVIREGYVAYKPPTYYANAQITNGSSSGQIIRNQSDTNATAYVGYSNRYSDGFYDPVVQASVSLSVQEVNELIANGCKKALVHFGVKNSATSSPETKWVVEKSWIPIVEQTFSDTYTHTTDIEVDLEADELFSYTASVSALYLSQWEDNMFASVSVTFTT